MGPEMTNIYQSELATLDQQIHDDCIVFIMRLCKGQNQFNYQAVKSLNDMLDIVLERAKQEARQNPKVTRSTLVTMGEGKFYSTGLSLQEPKVQADLPTFLSKHYLPLMGRFLCIPMVSVAAINGHAFAGGMVMAMAHDYRVMRCDRGYLCMNEIELPSPIPAGMAATIKAKLSRPDIARDCLQAGRRFKADEAKDLNMVDEVCSEAECLGKAIELAVKHARLIALMPIVEQIKRELYPEAIRLLEAPGSMKLVPELIMKSKL